MPNWQELAATSHYQTAVAVQHAVRTGDTASALEGLEELIDALSRSDRRALESYLMRLMQHIIQWRIQLERRSARRARWAVLDWRRILPLDMPELILLTSPCTSGEYRRMTSCITRRPSRLKSCALCIVQRYSASVVAQ